MSKRGAMMAAVRQQGAAPAVPFTLVGKSYVKRWYRSDVGVLAPGGAAAVDTNFVETWQDQSGNAGHATQPTALYRPTFIASDSRAGNQPSLGAITNANRFGLITPEITFSRMYAVVSYTNATFPDFVRIMSYTGGSFAAGGHTGTTSWYGSGSFSSQARKNGAVVSPTALPMPLSVVQMDGGPVTAAVWMGTQLDGSGRTWGGAITDFVFTDGTESEDSRLKIEGFLAHLRGINSSLVNGGLGGDHPYLILEPKE